MSGFSEFVENITVYLTNDSLDSNNLYNINLLDYSHYYDKTKTITHDISYDNAIVIGSSNLEVSGNNLILDFSTNMVNEEININDFDLSYQYTCDSNTSDWGDIHIKIVKGVFGIENSTGTISVLNPIPPNQNKIMNIASSNVNSNYFIKSINNDINLNIEYVIYNSSNNEVTSWNNKSNQKNNLTKPSGSNGLSQFNNPKFIHSDPNANNLPVIRFNENGNENHYLNATFSKTSLYSFFVVLKHPFDINKSYGYRSGSTTLDKSFINFGISPDGQSYHRSILAYGVWSGEFGFNNEILSLIDLQNVNSSFSNYSLVEINSFNDSAYNFTKDTLHLLNFTWNSSTNEYDIYINGVNKSTSKYNNNSLNNPLLFNEFGIGMGFLPANNSQTRVGNTSGDIAEVIIYNTQLTTQERSDIDNYLNKKWSINNPDPTAYDTLPTSTNPFIWLDAANMNYEKNWNFTYLPDSGRYNITNSNNNTSKEFLRYTQLDSSFKDSNGIVQRNIISSNNSIHSSAGSLYNDGKEIAIEVLSVQLKNVEGSDVSKNYIYKCLFSAGTALPYNNYFYFAPTSTIYSELERITGRTLEYVKVRMMFYEKVPGRFISLAHNVSGSGNAVATVYKLGDLYGPPISSDERYNQFDFKIYYEPEYNKYIVYNIDLDHYLHQYLKTQEYSSGFTPDSETTFNKYFLIEPYSYNGTTQYLLKTCEPSLSATQYLTFKDNYSTFGNNLGQDDAYGALDLAWFAAKDTSVPINQYIRFASISDPFPLYNGIVDTNYFFFAQNPNILTDNNGDKYIETHIITKASYNYGNGTFYSNKEFFIQDRGGWDYYVIGDPANASIPVTEFEYDYDGLTATAPDSEVWNISYDNVNGSWNITNTNTDSRLLYFAIGTISSIPANTAKGSPSLSNLFALSTLVESDFPLTNNNLQIKNDGNGYCQIYISVRGKNRYLFFVQGNYSLARNYGYISLIDEDLITSAFKDTTLFKIRTVINNVTDKLYIKSLHGNEKSIMRKHPSMWGGDMNNSVTEGKLGWTTFKEHASIFTITLSGDYTLNNEDDKLDYMLSNNITDNPPVAQDITINVNKSVGNPLSEISQTIIHESKLNYLKSRRLAVRIQENSTQDYITYSQNAGYLFVRADNNYTESWNTGVMIDPANSSNTIQLNTLQQQVFFINYNEDYNTWTLDTSNSIISNYSAGYATYQENSPYLTLTYDNANYENNLFRYNNLEFDISINSINLNTGTFEVNFIKYVHLDDAKKFMGTYLVDNDPTFGTYRRIVHSDTASNFIFQIQDFTQPTYTFNLENHNNLPYTNISISNDTIIYEASSVLLNDLNKVKNEKYYYSITDSDGFKSNLAIININNNFLPIANSESFNIAVGDEFISIDLSYTDYDNEMSELTISIIEETNSNLGSIRNSDGAEFDGSTPLSLNSNTVKFYPSYVSGGQYSFTYSVSDNATAISSTATETIDISFEIQANNIDNVIVIDNSSSSVDLATSITSKIETQDVSYEVVISTQPLHGDFSLNTLVYTPSKTNPIETTDSFDYYIKFSGKTQDVSSNIATVNIVYQYSPIANDTSLDFDLGEANLSTDLSYLDYDTSIADLSFEIIGQSNPNLGVLKNSAGETISLETLNRAVTHNAGKFEIDGVDNPTITLVRGNTYTFNLNLSSSHGIRFQTSNSWSNDDLYNNGLSHSDGSTSNSAQDKYDGILTFTVPSDAPANLYYLCTFSGHSNMKGTFNIVDNNTPVQLPSNTISYYPTYTGNGIDEITFRITDSNNNNSGEGKVSVNVNNLVILYSISNKNTLDDTALTFDFSAINYISTDDISFVVESGPSVGTLTKTSSAGVYNYTYTPPSRDTLSEGVNSVDITYKAKNAAGNYHSLTSSTLTIDLYYTPIIDNSDLDIINNVTDRSISLPADDFPDSINDLTFTINSIVNSNLGEFHNVTESYQKSNVLDSYPIDLSSDRFIFKSNTDAEGTVTINYSIKDAQDLSATGDYTLNIILNAKPIELPNNVVVDTETITIDLSNEFAGDKIIEYEIVSNALHGTTEFLSNQISYTRKNKADLPATFPETDSLTYRVKVESSPNPPLENGKIRLIAAGNNGLAYSDNHGESWTKITDSSAPTSRMRGIAYGNGIWVTVKFHSGGTIYFSNDNGETWQSSTTQPFSKGTQVVYDYYRNVFVAVGYQANSGYALLLFSQDGDTWHSSTGLPNNLSELISIAFSKKKYMVGNYSKIITANVENINNLNDLINASWTPISATDITNVRGLEYSNYNDLDTWVVATDNNSSNIILSYDDGETWEWQINKNVNTYINGYAIGIATDGFGKWVLTGAISDFRLGITYSHDNGHTWNEGVVINSGSYFWRGSLTAYWSGKYFIVASVNGTQFSSSYRGFAYSTDGHEWTKASGHMFEYAQGIFSNKEEHIKLLPAPYLSTPATITIDLKYTPDPIDTTNQIVNNQGKVIDISAIDSPDDINNLTFEIIDISNVLGKFYNIVNGVSDELDTTTLPGTSLEVGNRFYFEPSNNELGESVVTYRVTDTEGLTNSGEIILELKNIPVVSDSTKYIIKELTESLVLDFSADDVMNSNDTLKYKITNAPSNGNIIANYNLSYTDGSNIETWKDKSDNNRDISQSTVELQSKFSSVNYNNSIKFDNSSNYYELINDSSAVLTNELDIYIVHKTNDLSDNNSVLSLDNYSGDMTSTTPKLTELDIKLGENINFTYGHGTPLPNPPLADGQIRLIAAGNNGLAYSDNHGESWTKITDSSAPTSRMFGITHGITKNGNNVWITIQYHTGGTIYYSNDNGDTWQPSTTQPFSKGRNVEFDYYRKVFIALGFTANTGYTFLCFSEDGDTWYPSTGNLQPATLGRDFGFSENKYMIGHDTGIITTSVSGINDISGLIQADWSNILSNVIYSVKYANYNDEDTWVVATNTGGGDVAVSHDNGENWSYKQNVNQWIDGYAMGVATDGFGKWVVVGVTGGNRLGITYSHDNGNTWNQGVTVNSEADYWQGALSVYWSGKYFIAANDEKTPKAFAYSTDGHEWTKSSGYTFDYVEGIFSNKEEHIKNIISLTPKSQSTIVNSNLNTSDYNLYRLSFSKSTGVKKVFKNDTELLNDSANVDFTMDYANIPTNLKLGNNAMEIKELLVFGTHLNDTSNTSIVKYLANKWNIANINTDNALNNIETYKSELALWLDANNINAYSESDITVGTEFELNDNFEIVYVYTNTDISDDVINYQVKNLQNETSDAKFVINHRQLPKIFKNGSFLEDTSKSFIDLSCIDLDTSLSNLTFTVLDISFLDGATGNFYNVLTENTENTTESDKVQGNNFDLSFNQLYFEDVSENTGSIEITYKVTDNHGLSASGEHKVFLFNKIKTNDINNTDVNYQYEDYSFNLVSQDNTSSANSLKYEIVSYDSSKLTIHEISNNILRNSSGDLTNILTYSPIKEGNHFIQYKVIDEYIRNEGYEYDILSYIKTISLSVNNLLSKPVNFTESKVSGVSSETLVANYNLISDTESSANHIPITSGSNVADLTANNSFISAVTNLKKQIASTYFSDYDPATESNNAPDDSLEVKGKKTTIVKAMKELVIDNLVKNIKERKDDQGVVETNSINFLKVPKSMLYLPNSLGYLDKNNVNIYIPNSDPNSVNGKVVFETLDLNDTTFYVPLNDGQSITFEITHNSSIYTYQIIRNDYNSEERYFIRVKDSYGLQFFIDSLNDIDFITSNINGDTNTLDKTNYETESFYNTGKYSTYYKFGYLVPGDIVEIYGRKYIIGSTADAGLASGSVGSSAGDPYIYPIKSSVPVKLPDMKACYRIYEQGDNYVNALVDKASKEHTERMKEYVKKFTDNIDNVVVDGYFYKKFYINAEGRELLVDLKANKIVMTKQDRDYFTVERVKKKFKSGEFNNNAIGYEITWKTKNYGTIKTVALFFQNPHIENGIFVKPQNTKDAIGLMVRNYIPILMEIPTLNTCKYNKLHKNLLENKVIYENKPIKSKNEKWIFNKLH